MSFRSIQEKISTRCIVLLGIFALCQASFALFHNPNVRPKCLLKLVHGDDFAGVNLIGDEGDLSFEGGRRLASEFYQEVQVRGNRLGLKGDKISANLQNPILRETTQQKAKWGSTGLFQKGKHRMTVYSDRESGTDRLSSHKNSRPQGRTGSLRVPPPPQYRSPTQLSVSGAIAVVLLSRYFWFQALISVGLIGAYFAMVALTSSGGADWFSATAGMTWTSVVMEGAPVIERAAEQESTGSKVWEDNIL